MAKNGTLKQLYEGSKDAFHCPPHSWDGNEMALFAFTESAN